MKYNLDWVPACANLLDAEDQEVIKTDVIPEPQKHIIYGW